LCLILSHLTEEQNLSLSSHLKDLGWPTLVIPQIEDINSSETNSHRKMILLSEMKSNNIQILITPHSLIFEFESIKVIICLDPPEDTLAFLRRLNIDCVVIVFGTEAKLHPMIETCKLYDALALPLPNLVPDNHVTPPKSRTEYSGITVSLQDMNIYRDIARKAKNIKYLMETETWTHPRHQDISKKIILWQKEVRKSLLEKDSTSKRNTKPPPVPVESSTEQTNNNNTDTQVSSLGKKIRNQRSGNGELNPEKRYKFDTAYYQLFFPDENKTPAETPATVITNHQPANPPVSQSTNNEVQTQPHIESNNSKESKPTSKNYKDVMEEDD
jgi:hypothetical protein